ncbi:MAG: exodeoxyribonuclease V subunit gamma [Methylophaga sp.]|nr:exodeoxyribonuclease V subunit gamma [Methylophaga sp.]
MLTVIYSNSMQQLAGRLIAQMQATPLSPLQPETIMVQSNELARWLNLTLATQQSVAAHLQFPFPSAWLWRLFRSVWSDVPRESPYATDAMAWKIFKLLPTVANDPKFVEISRYLGEQQDPRKAYDLAQRIADSFDQYLMYRPDWIASWEAGHTPNWQAALWQLLTKDDKAPLHRARLLQRMQQALNDGSFPVDILPQRLSIFGLSALPPVYLDLLAAIAELSEVDIYLLSPSEDYWADLRSGKQQAQQLLLLEDNTDIEMGHPLLASLGKIGQTFFAQLQEKPHTAETHYLPPEPADLLSQLKADIYQLDPDNTTIPVDKEDDSLQIHSCHSPLREAEVLHDQLLNLFQQHPDLSPTDVLVMTPDIDLYAPAIEAVFSSQPASRHIPYSIANRGDAQQQAIISAFDGLLALPQSRFDVESIMALLECAAIQRRFQLNNQALEWIRDWLQQTYIRWGFSAEDKTALDLPANAANTWRSGLDRLLLGYALSPTDDDQWQLFEGQLPLAGISGERAQMVAQLNLFIEQLVNLRNALKRPRIPEDWQQYLLQCLSQIMSVEGEAEQLQLDALLAAIQHLAESSVQGGFNETIGIEVIRDWLKLHIELPGAEHQFMGRGVTFCDMVPMRSIPFDVVCLLGMNDSSFPRRQPKPGFDLLSTHYRPGDRSRRDDDRYLFLEAMLSANRHLYISYVGASIHDNTDIPPSVLVSDLRDVINQRFVDDKGQLVWPQLLTQHPLQAFSRRYFDGQTAKLFSFNAAACPPPTDEKFVHNWFAESLPEADDSWRFVSLNQLINFFSHPARYLAEQRLGIYFEDSAATLESREPFALNGLEAWSVKQQLLAGRMQDVTTEQIQPVIAASGVLPQGQFADLLFNQQLATVDAFAEQLKPLKPSTPLDPLAFEIACGEFTVTGQLQGLSATGLLQYRLGKTRASDLLRLWCSHLLLNCLKPRGVATQSRLLTENGLTTLEAVAAPESLLSDLLAIYWQGLHQAVPLLPKTSFAYAQAVLNGGRADPDTQAYKSWTTSFTVGEDADPYHRLLFNESPLNEAFQTLSLQVYQPIWDAMQGGNA